MGPQSCFAVLQVRSTRWILLRTGVALKNILKNKSFMRLDIITHLILALIRRTVIFKAYVCEKYMSSNVFIHDFNVTISMHNMFVFTLCISRCVVVSDSVCYMWIWVMVLVIPFKWIGLPIMSVKCWVNQWKNAIKMSITITLYVT